MSKIKQEAESSSNNVINEKNYKFIQGQISPTFLYWMLKRMIIHLQMSVCLKEKYK